MGQKINPIGFRLGLSHTGAFSAAVLMQGIVDAQRPQVFGDARFCILAAGLSDEAQFLPPGLHSFAQLLFGLSKVEGLVEPLGNQQRLERYKLLQLPDAVPVDQLQRRRLFIFFGLFDRGEEFYIPWECIQRIGDDIILIDKPFQRRDPRLERKRRKRC